jgi:hypothetical protein
VTTTTTQEPTMTATLELCRTKTGAQVHVRQAGSRAALCGAATCARTLGKVATCVTCNRLAKNIDRPTTHHREEATMASTTDKKARDREQARIRRALKALDGRIATGTVAADDLLDLRTEAMAINATTLVATADALLSRLGHVPTAADTDQDDVQPAAETDTALPMRPEDDYTRILRIVQGAFAADTREVATGLGCSVKRAAALCKNLERHGALYQTTVNDDPTTLWQLPSEDADVDELLATMEPAPAARKPAATDKPRAGTGKPGDLVRYWSHARATDGLVELRDMRVDDPGADPRWAVVCEHGKAYGETNLDKAYVQMAHPYRWCPDCRAAAAAKAKADAK